VAQAGIPPESTHGLLQFRWIKDELVAAVCILDLDVAAAERQEPILWERHRAHVSADGIWGYISVERSDAQGGLTIEPFYLESALREFDQHWKTAQQI
jgi:hypothetical protein